ncbi:tetratricopeptide repeat protein, partial [bacterium]|nr:tetratricopeptide repeat protein [bacterium]
MQLSKEYVVDLANAFIYRSQTDYAIQLYLKARKLMKGYYSFCYELAEIYNGQKEYEKMMEEYIGMVEFNSANLEDVQNTLQTLLSEDVDLKKSTALKVVLLKKIQQNPDETFYSEMLLWYSTQMKDFETALVQAKSLDKRKAEMGKRVFSLARLAASNAYYDVAISAYNYIIEKGADNYYFINSKMEILDVKYLKVTSTTTSTKQDIINLENDYKSALNELGKSSASLSMMKNLAHIQAFYLDKSADAITLLNEALEIKTAEPIALAECKIELADILLMTGEVWDATLLYSQVDKAFKNEPIGSMAKFKNAELSYYIGEFEWAKAQLDVLKASTSKLIANDAMALSLLISDNIDPDSTYEGLRMYSKADLYVFRNKTDSAIIMLDSLLQKFSYHPLNDEVYFKKAEIYAQKGLYDSAVVYYQKVFTDYSYDILADDATFKLAVMYEEVYKDSKKAMDLYDKLMTNYPGSTYVVEARKRYRALRGDV